MHMRKPYANENAMHAKMFGIQLFCYLIKPQSYGIRHAMLLNTFYMYVRNSNLGESLHLSLPPLPFPPLP